MDPANVILTVQISPISALFNLIEFPSYITMQKQPYNTLAQAS